MKVLICGSRTYSGAEIINATVFGLHQQHPDLVVIEGEADGADSLARDAAIACGASLDPYKADWKTYGRKAGYLRNREMLEKGKPDLVIAFIDKPLTESRGTHMMVNLATEAGVPTYVVRPSVETVTSWNKE